MKQIKKYIIIISCIIMVLTISIIIMNILKKPDVNVSSKEISDIDNNKNLQMISVDDISEYATIERLVNIYNSAINQLDVNLESMMIKQQNNISVEEIKKQYSDKGTKILEEILEKNYLKSNNFKEDLSKYLNNKFYINDMKKHKTNRVDIYLINISYTQKDNTNIIVFKDLKNNTFSILPSEYLKNKKIEESNILDIIKELNINEIEQNNNNKITEFNLDEERACLKYYYDYLNMVRNDINKLYLTLDKKYREKRFESKEDFENYINDNREKLEKAVLSNYQVKNRNGYIEYTCVDKDGRYYIFNATAAMKYTLYLDMYTIDLPEFSNKYKSTNDQGKVMLNTKKIITAINNKDYRYVYSKLADSFKNNYFNSEESLKEFLQNNIYNKNDVQFDDFEREGNIYTYKIRIIKKDEEGEEIPEGTNEPFKKFNIVMQLKDDTDFIMSFSIDE